MLRIYKQCLAFPNAYYTVKVNCKPVNRCHEKNFTVCRHNLQFTMPTTCLVHVGDIDFALHTRDQTRTAALLASFNSA
jgi:hypothetical protein